MSSSQNIDLLEKAVRAELKRLKINDRKVLTVPEAGALYFGLKRQASYYAAARGDIPTIRIGRLLRVPIVALDRMLKNAEKPRESK